jgi:uncharacterized integral membrane protein
MLCLLTKCAAAFDGWAKAPEIGVVLAVAVMGGMIIMSIEGKKK